MSHFRRGKVPLSILFGFVPLLFPSCSSTTRPPEASVTGGRPEVGREIERLTREVMSVPPGPERADVYRRIGDLHLQIRDYRGARDHYTFGVKHAEEGPERARFNYLIGVALLKDRHPSLALVYLERAEKEGVPPEARSRFHYYAAAVAQNLGNEELARRHLGLSRGYRPGADDPRVALAPESEAPRTGVSPGIEAEIRMGRQAILSRGSWRAAPPRANADPMGRISRLTVHHTAGRFGVLSQDRTASAIREIQRHHQGQNHWADIGYHFLVDPAGRAWEGRDLRLQGAHAGNPQANQGNIGIAVLGNFDEQAVTPAQRRTLVSLIESLMATYRIPADSVFTHQEIRRLYRLAWTDCPGRDLASVVDQFRSSSGARRPSLGREGGEADPAPDLRPALSDARSGPPGSR